MTTQINDWKDFLDFEQSKQYFVKLTQLLEREVQNYPILPDFKDVYKAFDLCPLNSIKVVIVGQDPYYNKEKATGLAFSVPKNVPIPPSLLNIYKEMHTDVGCYIPNHGNLDTLAKQGVLLINSVLTVREGLPNSHQNFGWETFVNNALELVSSCDNPIVFILWGNQAKRKKPLLNNDKHLILEGCHPSPLSARRGFFGCKHFSAANKFLLANGVSPIDWQIPNI